jgi:aerobic-type carbon monoxide dehydrogenase small subunit (CoxS/CutS family)
VTSDSVELRVNGVAYQAPLRAVDDVLADFLRDEVGAVDVKIGCREGACGACTVLVDGRAQPSCLTYLGRLEGAEIRTPADLAADDRGRHITECLVRHRAMQCGFCTPGVLSAVYALSAGNASSEGMAEKLRGHLCRCTGYERILDAAGEALGTVRVGAESSAI